MNNSDKTKSSRYISVRYHILAISTLPMLFACIVITFFASWTMEDGLRTQIMGNLRGCASGTLLLLNNISSGDYTLDGTDLYKGNFNITQNMRVIENYAKDNDVEISIYYGNKRKATTIQDAGGKQLTGTTADTEITNAVLKQGLEYKSPNITINDKLFYGYYMPFSDSQGNIVGMIFAGRPRAEIITYIEKRINFIIIIAALNYVSCFIIATTVSNLRIAKPLKKLTAAAKELAMGNIRLEIRKEANNEFGDLTDSFSLLTDNIIRQTHVAEKMSAGDLTISYQPVSEQDIMGHALEKMIHDNNENLTIINNATERMVAGVIEIATASNSLAQGTAQQASAVEEITASIGGIASSAEINARDATTANELVKKTREEAVHSNEQMDHMIAAMRDINEASENISKIMKIIDDIASQTNIISLNASVEAARAGEHGKGFAVVAEEIRNLANKSAEAAKNSAEMIQDAIKKTAIGSSLAAETASSLDEILRSVEEMTSLINDITEASVNQSVSVNQVNTGITQITDVLQNNSATSEECAATSTELSNLAGQLKEAVRKYNLK